MRRKLLALNACLLGPDAAPGLAEFDLLAAEVAREMTVKAGQKCTAIRRVLAPREAAAPLAEAIAAKLAAIKVGDPRSAEVRMGPLVNKSQQRAAADGIEALKREAQVAYEGGVFTAEGPKGKVSQPVFEGFPVEVDNGVVTISRSGDTGPERAKHGLLRALLANAVTGASTGFTKELDIVGVGYRAEVKGSQVQFALGYSHPVLFDIPEGIQISIDAKGESPVGVHTDVWFGSGARLFRDGLEPGPLEDVIYLEQAYGYYQWENGAELDAGLFGTIAGLEVAESHLNWNYTRGLLWAWNEPFSHLGVKFKAPITDTFTGTVMLVNGFDNAFDLEEWWCENYIEVAKKIVELEGKDPESVVARAKIEQAELKTKIEEDRKKFEEELAKKQEKEGK